MQARLLGRPTGDRPAHRVWPSERTHRRGGLWLGLAIMVLASGCGIGSMGATATGTPFTLSADQLMARLIERGDSGGFSKTADFGETCSQYLAGTERHQLVIGYEMFIAMLDVEHAVRGLPWTIGAGEPANQLQAEPFRVGLVSRCTEDPSDLVRKQASIEYIANHVTYWMS